MHNESLPTISSFVIRFVVEEQSASAGPSSWRGSVRHVQTEEELTFTQWENALDFMQQFLPQNTFDQPDGSE